ncbi:unnamed protein product [Fraxinus pennsylvanica]|uniref:Uncharacterized protein n=1 Tax=Fraxinus pennsylvanica TaxID=56036 RepID=A0AAD2AH48_9LAMI|nr:unnamed protein product [Fraxinus pennsylvanica]
MENKETPTNQLDPQPKCDRKSIPTMLEFIHKQEEPGGGGGGEEEDVLEMHGVPVPPITSLPVSVSDVTPVRPFRRPHRGRSSSSKRKRDNPNIEKQQAMLKKLQFLMETLKPVPFIPPKILYFSKHEKLLKKIGLWDFVHIDFDTNVRVDLIAQLVATYDSKLRCCYVNKFRIAANRTNLARALKLPVKRVKGNVGGVNGVDLGSEVLDEEETEFIEEILYDWVILHGDMWSIPNEVLSWVGRIKDGHPEDVDWAGLFWFMVEKELTQGEQLIDCYYASHLQYLIKSQHEEVFVLRDAVAKEEEEDRNNEVDVKVGGITEVREVMEGRSMELTLGENVGNKEEEVNNIEMMDAGECKDKDVEEQRRWLLDGKKNVGEHYMKSTSVEEGWRCSLIDDEKETIEKAAEDVFNINFLSDDDAHEGDGLTGNLLQAMVGNHLDFSAQGQLCEPSPVDLNSDVLDLASVPSFSNNAGKRFMVQDNDISQHSLEDNKNKRLMINNSWDHKPVSFGMCMEKMQQSAERFNLMYKEKEKTLQQLDRNQQILLNELQERDMMIKHLQKTKLEEIRTRDGELYRLQRELHLMSSILDGYKKAMKETQEAFAEYRKKSQLPEEPYYIDAGFGGLMLSATEIEKLHKKQEEEYTLNCLILEQKAKEAEENCAGRFEAYLEKVNLLDKKLTGIETVTKELTESYAKQKMKKKLLHS